MSRVSDIVSTFKGVAKVALQSRCTGFPVIDAGEHSLVIMGNGPSLRVLIDEGPERLKSYSLMAVNFAANTPEFFELKPRYYTIADPHFFTAVDDENVKRLIANLSRVSWPMYLFIPHAGKAMSALVENENVRIVGYNAVGVEGYRWFKWRAFDRAWGMPRPRNVLIPAIMIGIWLGFKTIYLAGADHSWTRCLSVADDNRVITNLPHYYKDNEHELRRVKAVYTDLHLHDLFLSYHIAFKAYHEIAPWALSRDVHIYNITPDSFIDAFDRCNLP